MKKIGIVYAISRAAGEHCKALIENNSPQNVEIVMHECSAEKYKEAANDVNQIASLLLQSICHLYNNGAKVIVIAANSVHRAFNIVNEQVKKLFPDATLISIIDAALEEIKNKKIKTVGIFGSNSTINSNMYQNKLLEEKITTVPLSIDDQFFINLLISSGVTPKTIKHDIKQNVIHLAKKLKHSGCEAIILACTELPLIFNSHNLEIMVVDTSLILSLAAIKNATPKNLDKSSTSSSLEITTLNRAFIKSRL